MRSSTRILIALLASAALTFGVVQGQAQASSVERQLAPTTEHACDATEGYPRDCITLPTGEGTHLDYVRPEGQIPRTFNDQDVYYRVVYWRYGCCSNNHWILVQSALKHLPNDGVERGVTFNNGGPGWNLADGSSVCGGAWVVSESRWVSIFATNGACEDIHR